MVDIKLRELLRQYLQSGDLQDLKAYVVALDRAGLIENIYDEFLPALARSFFVPEWANVEEERGVAYPGMDLFEAAPETPEEAVAYAKEYLEKLEALKDMSISAYLHLIKELSQGQHRRELDIEELGYLLAMSARGEGVGLWEVVNAKYQDLVDVPDAEYFYDPLVTGVLELETYIEDPYTTDDLYKLLTRQLDPMTFENVEKWVRQCYHMPSEDELIMEAANQILGGHGIEGIRNPETSELIASYINMGDSYILTVINDFERGFLITDWASYAERLEELDTEALYDEDEEGGEDDDEDEEGGEDDEEDEEDE